MKLALTAVAMLAGCATPAVIAETPARPQHSRGSWCGEVIAKMTAEPRADRAGLDDTFERTMAVRNDVESSLLACPGVTRINSVPEELITTKLWPIDPRQSSWVIAIELEPGSALLAKRHLFLDGVKVYFTTSLYPDTGPLSQPIAVVRD